MTRRLSPVPSPDPLPGGLDLAEARRSLLGVTQPAALRAVPAPPSDTPAAAEARERLQELRNAKRTALRELVALERTIERAGQASNLERASLHTITSLEQTLAERVTAWVRSGAEGATPALTADERRALEDARRHAAEAAEQAAAIDQALPELEQKRTRLTAQIAQVNRNIRAAAVELLGEELESAVTDAVRLARDAATARDRALARLTFLADAGYSARVPSTKEFLDPRTKMPLQGQFTEPRIVVDRERLKNGFAFSPDQSVFEEQKAVLHAQLEHLIAGEEV
jgi:hypothetical protein